MELGDGRLGSVYSVLTGMGPPPMPFWIPLAQYVAINQGSSLVDVDECAYSGCQEQYH